MTQPDNPHANMLGSIESLQSALTTWGPLYQVLQTYISLLAFTGTAGLALSMTGVFAYLAVGVVQVIVYTVCTWRASYRLEHVWRPSTIVHVRKVLWLAGPGSIVFTWLVQLCLARHWPTTPAASLWIVAIIAKVPMSPGLLRVAALAQSLCIAALWNRFLDRSPKVRELFSDPDGIDWRVARREQKARARADRLAAKQPEDGRHPGSPRVR